MAQQAETKSDVPGQAATQDFEAAVAAAVDARMEGFLERLTKKQAESAGAGDSQSMFREMALAIAEISDQGTNRKRVAPEILAARSSAHERMVAAIIEAKRAHEEDGAERPKYRATGKMYFNERFIEPFVVDPATKRPKPVEFRWSGVPNEVMRPLNKPAEEIYKHFLASIGSTAKVVAEKPVWLTAGGLVIEGESPRRREVSSPRPFDDDLEVETNANDPTKPFINVLGTVAAPARQNIGEAEKRA
jgi:hypothetical protein